jgi:hypothetical protein
MFLGADLPSGKPSSAAEVNRPAQPGKRSHAQPAQRVSIGEHPPFDRSEIRGHRLLIFTRISQTVDLARFWEEQSLRWPLCSWPAGPDRTFGNLPLAANRRMIAVQEPAVWGMSADNG